MTSSAHACSIRREGKLGRDTYRIDIHQRHTSKAAYKRDEFIEVIGSKPGNSSAKHDDEEAKYVLLPFDVWVVFPAFGEELVFCDSDRREDL